MKTVRKITQKGQVTLPSSWRNRTNADLVSFVENGDVLEIHPAEIITGEEVLFDAVRDNNGEGIPAGELIKALKKNVC
jgi:bifunctional DNA-binding transcriptional regulator/antitoxin component of YhaV-PrlF toxin-antitoxin module